MAQYQVLYWKEIPAVVEAIDGTDAARVSLSSRFQELIDSVAMLEGLSDGDAYLERWRKGVVATREGTAKDVAAEVAGELEANFPALRARYFEARHET
jgi:hypothetical protein